MQTTYDFIHDLEPTEADLESIEVPEYDFWDLWFDDTIVDE